ncbi:19940_t:CDS:2 [Gigaspora margarita]|uniref:19940_t:CDS:1 n=1 Tax=Gigaspora margarita TaxID=4874 RepID=A0ABN7URW2_GIGMA|nr:19940_t:CDS:2 [Gigaspora margarita]
MTNSLLDRKNNKTSELEEAKELYYYALTILKKFNTIEKRKENNIKFVSPLDKSETLYASLMDSSDRAKMYEHLNEKLKTRYDSACDLMKKIENELQRRRENVKSTFNELEKGIENWKEEQKIEAQKKLIIATVDLSFSVAKIVVQPVQETLTSVDIENIEKLYDVKENFDKLKDLENQVNKIQEIDKKTNKLDSNKKEERGIIESLDFNSLAKSTEWELTRRRMMKLLEFPIKQNIEGAEKYLISSENFFIFIDAYIKAKSEEIKTKSEEIESSDEFLRTSLQAKMSKGKKERSEIKPSVIKTFQELEKDMNKIRDELERVYEQFGCSYNPNWSLIKFNEEKYIEEFKNNRSVITEIPLNSEELLSYSLINLHVLRVYLEGVESENGTISLYISNTGTLDNRDKKKSKSTF